MKLPSTLPTSFNGKVERVLFHNADNGYAVLHIQAQDKAIGKVTVVGNFLDPYLGEQVTVHGDWRQHPKHGHQFNAQTINRITSSSEGKFLIQHIEGIGKKFALEIERVFGEDLSEILEKTPQRLREVSGIGLQRFNKIMHSWHQHKASHDIMLFLANLQVGFAFRAKIYKQYGAQTIEKITSNPYRLLTEIEGIGFQTADNMARHLQIANNEPSRLQAGICYALQLGTQYGQCGVIKQKLIEMSAQLLGVSLNDILIQLEKMAQDKLVIFDNVKEIVCVFLPLLWHQEQFIANKIKALLLQESSSIIPELLATLEKEIEKEALALSDEQYEAVKAALQTRVFVLTGGPGVGKTTLTRLLVNVYSQHKLQVGLSAPTGRAAKRLSEVTGKPAKTIHRLLEYDPFTNKFGFNTYLPLPYDVIIVDEASMLDVPLTAAILQALSLTTQLIFVGDVDQLSSVGPGDVLRSLIDSLQIPTVLLKTIFRQQMMSQIIVNAHRVNQGLMPTVDEKLTADFYLVNAQNVEDQQRKILTIVAQRLPKRLNIEPLQDIQVITPMNEGPLGVNSLNLLLQQELNPACVHKAQIKHRSGVLRENDKVIQIVNNYDKNIFNGDVGIIKAIHADTKKISVLFDQSVIDFDAKELEQLRLAYAITVHKAQGSEYPAVVIVLAMSQKKMLRRNLLYTAITRGKSCVVVVTQREALEKAVQTVEAATRINKLEERLVDEIADKK